MAIGGIGGLTLSGLTAISGARPVSALDVFAQGTPGAGINMVDELVIDLPIEPPSLDPAIVYDVDSWSVVHSIYDSLVQYGPTGELEMLLAESLSNPDPRTLEIKLRPGISFHNGEPLDAKAVAFSVKRLVDPKIAPTVSQTFRVIEEVKEVDPLTAQLKLSAPAPWLPSQIAAWLVIVPSAYSAGNDIGQKPVGTGPFRFLEWQSGDHITLEANSDYFAASPKGQPIARRVTFRFVPEASTRVSDLLAGTAQLVRTIPDLAGSVTDGGGRVIPNEIAGSAWIRIANDVAPFSDVRVRQALNYAVDVDAVIDALLGGHGTRLASFFMKESLGYDPNLKPYPHDVDKAKSLLAEAGYPDGLSTTLEHTTDENADVISAIAGQLAEAGIKVELQPREKATFNGTWKDKKAAPLRFSTWKPLFDPFTLLSLVVSNKGYLSRYDDPKAQALIDAGAIETDSSKRGETYRQLGQVLHDDPAAIYLYSLTSLYAESKDVPEWTQRPDDYIIPAKRNG
ncbi:MAG TPA: ABC transporter substrate-binding protein [Thermomicrobiales bacterium]|nr:ABC transporter substrate-binding protein [Thermomicrobiales bacterium]